VNTPLTRRVTTVSTAKVRLKEVCRVRYIRHRSRLANLLMLDEPVSDGYEPYIGLQGGSAVHMDRYSPPKYLFFICP
jgi:hypothetical protein